MDCLRVECVRVYACVPQHVCRGQRPPHPKLKNPNYRGLSLYIPLHTLSGILLWFPQNSCVENCISYFSAVVIKFHNQRHVREESIFCFTVPEG